VHQKFSPSNDDGNSGYVLLVIIPSTAFHFLPDVDNDGTNDEEQLDIILKIADVIHGRLQQLENLLDDENESEENADEANYIDDVPHFIGHAALRFKFTAQGGFIILVDLCCTIFQINHQNVGAEEGDESSIEAQRHEEQRSHFEPFQVQESSDDWVLEQFPLPRHDQRRQ